MTALADWFPIWIKKCLLIFRHQETISAKCSLFLPCYSRCRFGFKGNGLYIQHNCFFHFLHAIFSVRVFFCRLSSVIDDLFLQIISFCRLCLWSIWSLLHLPHFIEQGGPLFIHFRSFTINFIINYIISVANCGMYCWSFLLWWERYVTFSDFAPILSIPSSQVATLTSRSFEGLDPQDEL